MMIMHNANLGDSHYRLGLKYWLKLVKPKCYRIVEKNCGMQSGVTWPSPNRLPFFPVVPQPVIFFLSFKLGTRWTINNTMNLAFLTWNTMDQLGVQLWEV